MTPVYILTFHGSVNYGAVLQGYALNRTIREMGYACQTIDYNRQLHQKNYLKIQKSSMKGTVYQMLHWIPRKRLQSKFDRFVRSHTVMTTRSYNGFGALNAGAFPSDAIYFVGSDQIWNCGLTENNFHYYLDFVDSPNKNAYAASFGVSEVSSWPRWEQAASLLRKFRKISVREESAARILKDTLGMDVQVVCDPTFLLNAAQWDEVAQIPGQSGYILLFMLSCSDLLVKKARKMAEETGKKLININYSVGNLPGMKNVSCLSPEQWLGYIQNADMVFTNSFHGFALSLNLGRQAAAALSHDGKGSRIVDLAHRYGIERCIIPGDKSWEHDPYDIRSLSKKIQWDRERSLAFLGDVLHEST